MGYDCKRDRGRICRSSIGLSACGSRWRMRRNSSWAVEGLCRQTLADENLTQDLALKASA